MAVAPASDEQAHLLQQVTVLTVTYNSSHCVPALARGLRGVPHVIVVDNASGDDSCAAVAAQLTHARLLRMPRNQGYGVANNAGLAQVATPYALLLNPDCLVTPEQIAALVAQAQRWPEATVIAPQLLEANGTPQLNYSWPRAAWTPRTGGADGPLNVGYACAAVLLLNLRELAHTGAFDPRFFLYYEDEDLCLRIFQRHGQIIVVPEVQITTSRAARSRAISPGVPNTGGATTTPSPNSSSSTNTRAAAPPCAHGGGCWRPVAPT